MLFVVVVVVIVVVAFVVYIFINRDGLEPAMSVFCLCFFSHVGKWTQIALHPSVRDYLWTVFIFRYYRLKFLRLQLR